MNSLSKLGLHKVGSYVITSLILSNASLFSFVHLKLESFFIISCSGFTISVKSEMNLLTKFIFLRKDCMAFLLCGNEMTLMASILFGSIVITSRDITNPSNVPFSMANMLFFGFYEIPYHRHCLKITFRCGT